MSRSWARKWVGAGAVAIFALWVISLSGRSAAAESGSPSSVMVPSSSQSATIPIKHVIVLLQENHSFDNVLGPFCAEVASHRIVRPGTGSKCDGATTGLTTSGTSVPLAQATDYVPTASHSVAGQQADIDGGKMDGFNTDPNCSSQLSNCYNAYGALSGLCGTSGSASCIPNLVTLANRYAISDRTFESNQTPSWAGHLVWATANLDGFEGLIPADPTAGEPHAQSSGPGWGCDAGTVTPWGPSGTIVPSCVPDSTGSLGPNWAGYSGPMAPYVPTIFDELQAKGLSWKLYGGAGTPGPTGSGGHFTGSGWAWAICPTFAECLYSSQRSHLVPATQVINDAAAGTLPSFSIITPTVANSQHNNDDMSVGDNWVGQVMSALEASPEWSSTAVFVTYDDCGCFYDHVNPLQFNPQWGIRVPMIIVSPWAKLGYTDSKPTTFAGTLAYVEHLFGLPALDQSTDAVAYNYQGAFCYHPAPGGCQAAGTSPDAFVTTKAHSMTPSQLKAQASAADDDT